MKTIAFSSLTRRCTGDEELYISDCSEEIQLLLVLIKKAVQVRLKIRSKLRLVLIFAKSKVY